MKDIRTYLKQGMTLTNGKMEFKYEYDDNGQIVVEVYDKSSNTTEYINKDEFENLYNINELKIA